MGPKEPGAPWLGAAGATVHSAWHCSMDLSLSLSLLGAHPEYTCKISFKPRNEHQKTHGKLGSYNYRMNHMKFNKDLTQIFIRHAKNMLEAPVWAYS